MASEKIGFQGELGAYSHLACRQARPQMQPVPYASFEETFAALREGAVERTMIPIENPSGGRVADIHNLLPDSGLFIVDEHFQPIHHHLLAVPGASLADIKSVRSHVQALSQCRQQIRSLGLRPVATADTAGAAKQIAENGDPQTAAIASDLAGEIYGLSILRSHIEDQRENTTRFVLMSRTPEHPTPDRPCMTSIFFQVRSVPAALYKALGGFATNGVNITKLESYIVDARFTVARFYAEFEGHVDSPQVKQALEELRFYSSVVTILGVYPIHSFRAGGGAMA
ncbi:prephenate dehydratase [Thioalkalivibrio sp. HK1]|uniref:prephenate dehydratase n=1 Tax=Thioalkalivibrio sp. HK1 TaxID=1469245 RepID=UPI0004729261|nr:prephenate dehydratase [Thioalkalivibrio sp. HK1]